MNCWVLQMGYPVVIIDTSTGKVSQKHFLLDPESNVTLQSPYKYTTLLHFINAETPVTQSADLRYISPVLVFTVLLPIAING